MCTLLNAAICFIWHSNEFRSLSCESNFVYRATICNLQFVLRNWMIDQASSNSFQNCSCKLEWRQNTSKTHATTLKIKLWKNKSYIAVAVKDDDLILIADSNKTVQHKTEERAVDDSQHFNSLCSGSI